MTVTHATDDKNCDCPACDLTREYIADYEAYKKKKPYITFEMGSSKNHEEMEDWLNKNQADGYELTAAHRGVLIMRSVPPQPPTPQQVIAEVQRRQQKGDAVDGEYNLENLDISKMSKT